MSENRHFPTIKLSKLVSVAIVTVITVIINQNAWTQVGHRSGKQVVEVVCSTCHGTGEQGAPKIGDAKAWSERTSQGLSALARHAINGIRQMPAHGGNPGVTDFEIKLAVTYMVNQSGGSWTEPIDKRIPRVERKPEQIVQAHCAKCHQTGESGAPKIGDMNAWIPRLRQGVDGATRSAIHGHGGMPPRGGVADLTDAELRGAVIYMLHPVSTRTMGSSSVATPKPGGYHKAVGDMDIYLGIVLAKSIHASEDTMHGGIPSGKGYYHVNVSLLDSRTDAQIMDAQVELTVKDPLMGDKTKELELMAINQAISYGGYFRMTGWETYSITVRIWRPDQPRAIKADFKFRPN